MNNLAARLRMAAGWLHLLGAVRVAVWGRSMEPALLDGDHLLIDRLAYRFGTPRRGQIAVLRTSSYGSLLPSECIKRIVGLPYEHVIIDGYLVYIDGQRLSEPHVLEAATPPLELTRRLGTPHSWSAAAWQLGRDEYFLLGDNRVHSTDSRTWGAVHRKQLFGPAWYRYAPRARRSRLYV